MARIDLIDADRPRLIRLKLLRKRKANKFPTACFSTSLETSSLFFGKTCFRHDRGVDLYKAIAFDSFSLFFFLSPSWRRNRSRENVRAWGSKNRVEKLKRI